MVFGLSLLELLAPLTGIGSLLFAAYLYFWINKFEIGNEKMVEIYNAIRDGSKAY